MYESFLSIPLLCTKSHKLIIACLTSLSNLYTANRINMLSIKQILFGSSSSSMSFFKKNSVGLYNEVWDFLFGFQTTPHLLYIQ